jgi:uncharacterized membrane protein YkoI
MKFLSSLLALAITVGCGPAFAADQDKTKKPWPAKISKAKAQEASLKLVPGELLCWDLQIEAGEPEYAFYVKSKDGRISEIELNGNTGKKENIGILVDSHSSDGRSIKTTNAADRARLKDALVHDFRVVGKSGKKVVTVNAVTGKIMSVSQFVDGQGR